jgi:hypothetical protein
MAHTDHGHGAHDSADSVAAGHEVTDIPLAGTTRVGMLTLAVVATIMAVMYGLWGLFESRLRQQDTPPPPMADSAFGKRVPALPRLQSQPAPDLASYRKAQRDKLASYGWVDQGAGVARIPIDRAIELMAERASTIADPQPAAAAPAAQPGQPAPTPAEPKPAQPAAPQPGGPKPGGPQPGGPQPGGPQPGGH